MDIFQKLRRQTMDQYRAAYLEKNKAPEFYYLDRKRGPVKQHEQQADVVTAKNRDLIYGELMDFYRLAGDGNPFQYFSKLEFVLRHRDANDPVWSKELFLRLISDRCVLFMEHRRYACSEGGLHTLIERKRNEWTDPAHGAIAFAQEAEPMTSTHVDYYNEYRRNYQTISEALERRRYLVGISGTLLEQLNKLGKTCKRARSDEKQECPRWSEDIASIARTYLASVIWQTGKREYIELFDRIFVQKVTTATEPFYRGIQSIAERLTVHGHPHWLTPLVLYFIFTRSTKALLEGNVGKFWSKVGRCSKAAHVSAMTELSGRKAGVNLALYEALRVRFGGLDKKFSLPPGISLDLSLWENDTRAMQRDTLDFLFNLTTGYGMLFHCHMRYGPVKKPLSEIYGYDVNEPVEMSVFRYSPNYRHPVDDLRYLIRSDIDACFANRAEFLTPGVYARPSRLELAKLSDLVLQDMALPAAERISRLIQKTISESPQILEEYRPFLCEFCESGAVTECLQRIMDTWFPSLDGLVERYQAAEVQRGDYDHRQILRALVEYEIRHHLYKEGSDILTSVAERVFQDEQHLFIIGL